MRSLAYYNRIEMVKPKSYTKKAPAEGVKGKFYEDLEALIIVVPKEDKVVILWDFNTREGTDYQIWEGVIGRNRASKNNSNGHL